MKNKGGRPTKYRPEYIKAVEDYLTECGRNNTKLPKRVDVALMLEVDEYTIDRWGKRYPKFCGAMKRVDESQKSQLIDDSFFGGKEINANVGIFLLKTNHGMVEKSALDITSGNKPLPAPLIDVRADNSHKETATTKEKD